MESNMNTLIAEGKSIIDEVNAINYEDIVDAANDWLSRVEQAVTPTIMDKIFKIAARTLKPKFNTNNPFVVLPVTIELDEKVEFFQKKLAEIIEILENLKQ